MHCNGSFVLLGWQNLKVFTLPARQHGYFHGSCPESRISNESCRLLIVLSLALFAYNLSNILDNRLGTSNWGHLQISESRTVAVTRFLIDLWLGRLASSVLIVFFVFHVVLCLSLFQLVREPLFSIRARPAFRWLYIWQCVCLWRFATFGPCRLLVMRNWWPSILLHDRFEVCPRCPYQGVPDM